MSESKVITALLQDKQMHHMLQGNVDGIIVTHKDIWSFIKQYYADNNAVPPTTLILEKFPDFIPDGGIGSTKYHLEELRNEYLDRELRQIIRSAAEAVSDGEPSKSMELLSSGIRSLNQEVNVVKDIDATDTDAAVAYIRQLLESSTLAHGIKTDLIGLDACFPSGIRGGQFGIVLAYPAVGKPTTLDTPVATPNGWVPKGDLKVGDHVIARDGKPTMVLATIDQGMLDAYRVSFRDGTSVIVGPDHDWTVYSRDTYYNSKATFVKTTLQLMEDGLEYQRNDGSRRKPLPKYCIPNVEPVEYSERNLPIDPYTLGVLLGDGCIKKQPVFITNDKEVAERIQSNNPGYTVTKHKKFDGAGQKYLIKGMMPAIRQLGVNLGSYDKRVPQEYLFTSIDQRLELLRGLMDSDGSCQPRSRAIFHSCNRGLANDVAELVRSLGGTARVDVYERPSKPTEYVVRMRLRFNPFNLDRKASNYIVKDWPRWIASIEYVGKKEMRCISVGDSEHLYAVNDYIMTHNSYFTLYLLAKAWLQGFTPMIVSLEMSETEVRNRLYTILGNGRWSLRKLSSGAIDIEEFERWHHKMFDGKHPFHIISMDSVGGEVTPEVLRAKINQYKPDVVVADYMQLMSPNSRVDSEVVKMKNLSREMKLLAMSEKVPIIAISSATPTDTHDMSEPPTLAQTAWSRQMAYDADFILALGRELTSDIMVVVGRKNREGMLPDFMMRVDMDAGMFMYKDLSDIE